jgi:hypothetical protein
MVKRMEGADVPFVFTAKAVGASNIHHVTMTQHLDFAILFSSTSTYGSLGIAAHSSANALLDGIAQCTRASGLQKASLVVPGILGVGAGAAIALAAANAEDPAVRAMSLTTDQLMQSIELLICGSTAQMSGPLHSDLHALMGSVVPVSWLLRETFESPATALTRNLTPHERVSAARAALCALDDVMTRTAPATHPEATDAVIVGGGITGLTVAAAIKEAGANMFVVERRASIGGVWRSYGNPHSRVNSTEPAYRMLVRRSEPNTDHSFLFEIIDDIRFIIEQHHLAPRILLRWAASCVCSQGLHEQWRVHSKRADPHTTPADSSTLDLIADQVVLCINRRLGAPRAVHYEDEALFEGLVMRGLSGDNVGVPWAGKRAVILGHGPYAVEQVPVLPSQPCLNMDSLRRTE